MDGTRDGALHDIGVGDTLAYRAIHLRELGKDSTTDFEGAERAYTRVIEINPRDHTAYEMRGWLPIERTPLDGSPGDAAGKTTGDSGSGRHIRSFRGKAAERRKSNKDF